MTFSMEAFGATQFDLPHFLRKLNLTNFQSPYYVIYALSLKEKNLPALHMDTNPNPKLLPEWIMQLNQESQ